MIYDNVHFAQRSGESEERGTKIDKYEDVSNLVKDEGEKKKDEHAYVYQNFHST